MCVVHTTPADYMHSLPAYKFLQAWKSKKCNNNDKRFYFKNSMKNTHVNPGLDNQGTGVNIKT